MTDKFWTDDHIAIATDILPRAREGGIQMTPETLEALRGSIEKWEKIVAGKAEDEGPNNCPLCLMFLLDTERNRRPRELECVGCPVMKHTGQKGCNGTPYDDYELADDDDDYDKRKLAIDELNFLKSLLPSSE